MKRILAFILIMILTLPGCSPQSASSQDPLAGWLAAARLDARETPEELYAAALHEEMLVIYSTSTRMMDAAASFEARYPGLMVQVEHTRGGEVFDKLTQNYDSGDFVCDIIVSSNSQGIMTNEFLEKNIAVKYVPHDIKDKILSGNDTELLTLAGEAVVFAYNETCYAEPPVGNWWELTEEKWRGKVYVPNPARSTTTLALFAMMIEKSDLMEQAYVDLYGEPLSIPDGETAGHVFIRRFVENGAVIVHSSDEVAEAVGYPGSVNSSVGIMVSSKTRLRDIGYEIVNHYGMEPFCGVYTPVHIMLAGGSKNVNAAKLFIHWALGESDGQGEGYRPYLQSGAWSVRNDVQDDTGVRIDELNLLYQDGNFLYENFDGILSFWEGLIEQQR